MTALKDSIKPGLPVFCSCLALTTSIGTGLLVTVRCSAPRLPVTTTVDRVLSSWACAAPANRASASAVVGCKTCFMATPNFPDREVGQSRRRRDGARCTVIREV